MSISVHFSSSFFTFVQVPVLEQDNDLSKSFTSLLKSFRLSNPALYQQCLFVRQGDQPREGFLVLFNLVEDRPAGSIGYAEWMVQIFRQVKQKTWWYIVYCSLSTPCNFNYSSSPYCSPAWKLIPHFFASQDTLPMKRTELIKELLVYREERVCIHHLNFCL